jgi:PAS domain S-box-containing protein
MNLFAFGYFLAFLLITTLGSLILVRNVRSQTNRVFFVLSMAVAFTAFGQFEFVRAESFERAAFWYKSGVLWPIVLGLLLHFSIIFPQSSEKSISFRRGLAIYTPAVIILIGLIIAPASSLSMPVRVGNHWAISRPESPTFFNSVIIILSTVYTVLITAVCLIQLVRADTMVKRRRRTIVFSGVAVGLISSILAYGVFQSMGLTIPDMATYGFAVGCMLIGYAAWKYNLFPLDISAAARDIVRAMPSALILIGKDRKIVKINNAAAQLLQVDSDELGGVGFLSIFPADEQREIEDICTIVEDEPSLDTMIFDGTGKQIPVSLSFAAVLDKSGERIGTACVGRDLRPEITAEAEKEDLRERLLQAEKMEAIGRLAGGVAHDFNNILGGILGYADLIMTELGSQDRLLKDYAENIIDGSRRAAGLVANLLAFSRKGRIKLAPVDINGVIRKVADLLAHSVDKRVEVFLQLYDGSPFVLADAAQLHNAILNLAVNSTDALPLGGNITISTDRRRMSAEEISKRGVELDVGEYVVCSIADTGAGMDKATLDRVFEPFFTTKEIGRGTGLGLASVYGAVRNCNGAITVESVVGEGSTFTMYLPIAVGEVKHRLPAARPLHQKNTTVLVIDDEKSVGDFMGKALKSIGCRAAVFEDGSAAVDYFSETSVDLVILDLNMPNKNGYEIFEELKAIDPHVLVLVATGHGSGDQRETIHSSGAAGLIQKPFGIAEFTEAVTKLLQKTRI